MGRRRDSPVEIKQEKEEENMVRRRISSGRDKRKSPGHEKSRRHDSSDKEIRNKVVRSKRDSSDDSDEGDERRKNYNWTRGAGKSPSQEKRIKSSERSPVRVRRHRIDSPA